MPQNARHDPFPVNPRYHGIYSHGVETLPVTRMLHVSGQIGVSPDGELADGFTAQCEQALENVAAVLDSASMDYSNLVKLTFFLVRPSDMEDLVEVRKALLDGVRPAITTIFVAGLVSPDWLIEVEAVAAEKDPGLEPFRWRLASFR